MDVFYCTLEDLTGAGIPEADIITLAAEKGDKSGVLDEANFDACRRAARGVIDGFAMMRYSSMIPFSPVPEAIKTIAICLTKYQLYSRKNSITNTLQTEYDNQISILKSISNGTFKLFGESAPVQKDSIAFTDVAPEDRKFHSSKITGYLPGE